MSSPIVEAKIQPNLVNSVVHVVAEAQAVALTIVGSTLQNGRKIGDKPSSPRPLQGHSFSPCGRTEQGRSASVLKGGTEGRNCGPPVDNGLYDFNQL